MTAFHGDPAVKAALLARIMAHRAAGMLDLSGTTLWAEGCGSPLGVSIGSTDPTRYAEAFGYPIALAAALDILAAQADDGAGAGFVFVREWVEGVTPGADLGGVPARLMLHLLAAEELVDGDAGVRGQLVVLHGLSASGRPASSDAWRAIRQQVVDMADETAAPAQMAIQAFWEATCWPADRGRSTLVSAINAWRRLQPPVHPDWSSEDEARSLAILNAIWTEQQPARDAGDEPHYMTLFRQRVPDLADRFGANQQRLHDHSIRRAADLSRHCLLELEHA